MVRLREILVWERNLWALSSTNIPARCSVHLYSRSTFMEHVSGAVAMSILWRKKTKNPVLLSKTPARLGLHISCRFVSVFLVIFFLFSAVSGFLLIMFLLHANMVDHRYLLTAGTLLKRITIVLAVYTAFASAGCYAPDGTYEPDDVPCLPDQEDSFCCQAGYVCLSNKLCYATSASKDYDPKNPNGRTRRGCTDPSWDSPECPQFCLGKLPP